MGNSSNFGGKPVFYLVFVEIFGYFCINRASRDVFRKNNGAAGPAAAAVVQFWGTVQ
jgi:hypothetical protein